MSSSASSYSLSKQSLLYVTLAGSNPSHLTISNMLVKYFSSSFSGFVSSYRKLQAPL